MRVIATEEHIVTPDVIAAWRKLDPRWQDVGFHDSTSGAPGAALLAMSEQRIAAMDEAGIDVSVLSLTTPGVQNLEAGDAVRLQTQVNDLLAETVRAQPDRFQALATLATPDPQAAAKELERAVTTLGLNGAMVFGRTRDRNMDDPAYWPIYEAAAAMRVPLYLHPQSARLEVCAALYEGFDPDVSRLFAISGIGWHYEAGVQAIRLILSGVLDRFPDLQIILGHWGEVMLFYLERLDLLAKAARLPRTFQQYARDQFHVGPSGLFSQRYMRWATEVIGIDRILFSTDYPFGGRDAGEVRRFLAEAPFSDDDRAKVAGGNWDRIVAGIRR
ncbi:MULTISPECIES: amidohydrolase family protein [unclassified Sphingomonas]|uniref:amidohydrolase family protein n=1 Tax=unclassified Sphingomonas TaxID=196159 RepID=UPI00226A65C2|nr:MULTISPECIES: amidohydrolase family protein [unclassified Sphingomonas]